MGCNCHSVGAFELAAHAGGAAMRIGQAALSGEAVKAAPGVIAARLEICRRRCAYCQPVIKGDRTYHRCRVCGCWLDGKFFAKASLATETCPKGEWEAA